jgi:hypothetical protein
MFLSCQLLHKRFANGPRADKANGKFSRRARFRRELSHRFKFVNYAELLAASVSMCTALEAPSSERYRMQ